MRIWMDPAKMEKYADALGPGSALNAQNAQVSAGQLGALPAVQNQQLNATITARTKLKTPEQFEASCSSRPPTARWSPSRTWRAWSWGRQPVHPGQAQRHARRGHGHHPGRRRQRHGGVGCRGRQAGRAQALLPNQIDYFVSSDSTPFVRASISEVVHALGEAMVLVVIVMFVFLQNFRATLIPAIAVPVVLLGTFGVLSLRASPSTP
jgi:HAE1 family hydrophobic/amphiphilic exporter-1